jgi:hypothetical protein
MLMRTSRIRASPTAHRSHHERRHFHTRTQTQLERAAARLAGFGLFKLECACREGIGWRRRRIMAGRRREAAREAEM